MKTVSKSGMTTFVEPLAELNGMLGGSGMFLSSKEPVQSSGLAVTVISGFWKLIVVVWPVGKTSQL